MSLLQRLPGVALTSAAAALVGAAAWWLVTNKPDQPKTDKPPPAAKVEKVVQEDDLARVIVGEKAVERIGLTVGAVEAKAVRRVRVYGGEVAIPDGRRIPVTASLAGTLAAPTGGMPKAGQAVKAGDALFQLLPLLSPEGRITMAGTLATADGLVKTTEKRVEAARVALERARSSAVITGGKGPVEAAQGAYDVAVEEQDVAAVNRKVLAALSHGLKPILCVGETLAENEAGQTEAVLERQVREALEGAAAHAANIVVAYEPIWAIGTGRAATANDAQRRCWFIRNELRKIFGDEADTIRIQYGGSVTPANAAEILSKPDVDGALVGGASLKSADFVAIVAAAA